MEKKSLENYRILEYLIVFWIYGGMYREIFYYRLAEIIEGFLRNN